MKRRFFLLSLLIAGITSLVLLNLSALGRAQAAIAVSADMSVDAETAVSGVTTTMPAWQPAGLFAHYRDDGVISIRHQSVFGPQICTAYGDPFSPLNSPWAPGYYTYTYRIRIPASYPEDIVRVELFDPDSINQPGQTFTVHHTLLAQTLGGLPPSEMLNCSSSQQQQPCLIDTSERFVPGTAFDEINPYWFVRSDENRGSGGGDGNGACGSPASYTPRYNTETVYQLYYFAEQGGAPQRTLLAAYTGQVGDGARDNGTHLTDLQWIAPGAPAGLGQPAAVPTSCGSPNGGDYDAGTCPTGTPPTAGDGFEVSLSQDTPAMATDPENGDRYLYLDVATISGASENGFEIWAGPNSYTSTSPTDANLRNIYLLDNPGAGDTQDVEVFAVEHLPVNSNESNRLDIPLVTIEPEQAGQDLFISLFDSDSGAAPPLLIFFDSIPRSDWVITFTPPGPHSCYPGSCNNQWATPPYTVTIPGDFSGCDFQNPDPQHCTPFSGGRLMASYDGGIYDTHVWQVDEPGTSSWNDSISCQAFPIAGPVSSRAVTAPGTGLHPFPDPGQFDYPTSPPAYSDFQDHIPDLPLSQAQPGSLYLWHQGVAADDFGWLVWNEGIPANAATLANSLGWPGDTLDYTDHGDAGQPASSLYPYVVRGFVHPSDPTDVILQRGDPIAALTGAVVSNGVRAELMAHVDMERVLRLPVWDQYDAGNGRYQVARFGAFRLLGYKMSGVDAWLLLEFIRWDDSCGAPVAPQALTLAGPATGMAGELQPFTATVTPVTATVPITYVWQTEASTLIQVSGPQVSAAFAWSNWGRQMVTVTANNGGGLPVVATHTIQISPNQLFLPLVTTPVCSTTAVASLTISPTTATLQVGERLTPTLTLANTSCNALVGLPLYRLWLTPTGVVTATVPTQVLHSLGLSAGETDVAYLGVEAQQPGMVMVRGNVSYEVHSAPPPGSAYWSGTSTAVPLEITVLP